MSKTAAEFARATVRDWVAYTRQHGNSPSELTEFVTRTLESYGAQMRKAGRLEGLKQAEGICERWLGIERGVHRVHEELRTLLLTLTEPGAGEAA